MPQVITVSNLYTYFVYAFCTEWHAENELTANALLNSKPDDYILVGHICQGNVSITIDAGTGKSLRVP